MTVASWTLSVGFAALFAIPALAEGRVALIVAATGEGAGAKAVRADAQDLSESLFGMGFTVTRLENPTAAQVGTVAAGLPRDGTALFYFAGPAVDEAGAAVLLLGAEKLPLDATIASLQARRTGQTLVLLDTCHGAGAAMAEPAVVDNLFVAMPNAPGVACVPDAPGLTVQFLEKVAAPGVPLTEAMPATPVPAAGQLPAVPGLWVRSSLTTPFTFRVVQSGTQLSAADYRMLERLPAAEREKLLALWQAAGIAVDIDRPAGGVVTAVVQDQVIVASPVQPVTASIITPVANVISPIVAGAEVQGAQLAILTAAPARTGARPVPGAGGLPQPSVILGEAPTLVALDVAPPPVTPPAQVLDYTDVTARAAAKAADPAAFDQLVLTGAYDPPAQQLPVAVQTELKRMGCYRGGVDGQWGPGSRRALQLYFDTLQVATTTQEPTIEVFHQLLQKDQVACPAPVATAAPAATTTRNTTRTTTQAAAPATPRKPAAAAPAAPAAPATTGRRIRQNTGTGAFR
jgi:hypothetical protein